MIENEVYQSAIDVLALLVRNRAGSLASGLAGSLALAAAALNSALLQVCFIQGLNLFHDKPSIHFSVATIIAYFGEIEKSYFVFSGKFRRSTLLIHYCDQPADRTAQTHY